MGQPTRRRNSMHLQDYDYAQPGAYFVTVCVEDRKSLLGCVENGVFRESAAGAVVRMVWEGLPGHYTGVELDEFCVMPNHFHGIVWLTGDASEVGSKGQDARWDPGRGRAGLRPAPTEPRNEDATEVKSGIVGGTDPQDEDATRTRSRIVGAGLRPALPGIAPHHQSASGEMREAKSGNRPGLSEILRAFKSFSAREINLIRHTPGSTFWQRGYYEHVIRDNEDLDTIRAYIVNNALKWSLDGYYPGKQKPAKDKQQ